MTKNYTISEAMQASIEAVKAHFSFGYDFRLKFFVEEAGYGDDEGFYDGCEMIYDNKDLKGISFKTIMVNYEGEIYDCGDGYYASADDLNNAMKK